MALPPRPPSIPLLLRSGLVGLPFIERIDRHQSRTARDTVMPRAAYFWSVTGSITLSVGAGDSSAGGFMFGEEAHAWSKRTTREIRSMLEVNVKKL